MTDYDRIEKDAELERNFEPLFYVMDKLMAKGVTTDEAARLATDIFISSLPEEET